eukprot:6269067-Amphidinium_carterae.1
MDVLLPVTFGRMAHRWMSFWLQASKASACLEPACMVCHLGGTKYTYFDIKCNQAVLNPYQFMTKGQENISRAS